VVRQGEFYDHEARGHRYRVLVVSSDAHNAVAMPWVVPLRRRAMDAPPYLVAMSEADPLSGTADIGRLTQVSVSGEPIGLVAGATMDRVRSAINDIFSG
jgi:hypothetical protein